ncbi:PREDICTED: uncharacterized protein KIAA1551 homolog [Elephantulus edwardii]|uniref:uncharacterized protein KIAA1551 homolog n=1 Tax=Elephantulus edwardii TaxID=28737 RepID=UPI0003F08372|nr:PREDICTED: uncharacterized protein KIAA1551 homolog [Elephantulus edwardii]
MNWNVNSESTTVPPLYAKSQSSFLQQPLINPLASASQSSLNFPGSKQEACMYPCPVSQPLLMIKNYAIPQQTSVSVMPNGTSAPLQASVERKPYANVQGPKQLNHSLQMSSGVTQNKWLNSTVRNPVLSHTRATVVSNQVGFGMNTSNTHVLQNQFVTSDSYAVQLQMIPSNPTQGPVMSQGNQGLNQSCQERQIDWAQQHSSSGLTFPDSRSLPKQYYYSQQSFLQDPTFQRQNPMLSKLLDVKNSSHPHHALFSHSQQNASVQSPPYAVPQSDNIPPPLPPPPPPPPYECRYANQPSQSTPHVPLTQKAHISEIMKELCRGIQQPCQNRDKEVNYKVNGKVSTNESFYNLTVNQPVNNKPVRCADGVQILVQDSQGKTMDSCSSTSNQLQDTNVTKEGLASDIQKLVEMKKKFFELARKIKINKKLLMAAGCSKATNASLRESTQNSESSSKHISKLHSGLQITPVNSEFSEGHSATVMRCTEETSQWNPNIQEVNCRKLTQDNSNSPNSNCSQKVLRVDQCHDFQPSLKTSPVEITQTLNNNTQTSSENVRNCQNLPSKSKTITTLQSVFYQELFSEPPNKNTLLQFLTPKDQAKDDPVKNGSEIIQDPKSNNFRINQHIQFTNEPTNFKTLETQSAPHVNAMVTDKSFCLDHRSSANEMSCKSEEVLKTCLSLWKKQPSDPTEKQCNELRTNVTVADVSKPVEVNDKIACTIVGNSKNRKLNNTEQEATLPVVVQNYESAGSNITKGSELQIAVVSPLILSDVRTLSAKEMTPIALTETAYPVIEEGSVCSLQNHLMENISVAAALKAHDNELVSNTTLSTKITPVIQKEKHDKSTNCSSGQIPNDNQRMPIKSKLEVHIAPNEAISPHVSAEPAMDEPKDNIGVNDVLQIANICSLVEGDVSYNSHIAKIFNSPCFNKVEPQKSCLSDQVKSCRQQNEELDKTENKNFEFQKDIVQDTNVSLKINDQSEPLPSSESSYTEAKTEILEESKMECIIEKENISSVTHPSAVIQQTGLENDIPCSYTSQDALSSEILGEKTDDLYLQDQLSELLKEFPYGIDVLSSKKGSLAPQIIEKEPKDQNCHKPDCDSRVSTDEIKITIISSEQMKELFPEQDNQLSDRDRLTEPQMENSITKVESQCDTKTCVEEKRSHSSVSSNMQKDDIHCCALGWLAQIYEGVPQCQCNSNKNVVSEEENQRSPLKSNSYKQEIISDGNTPVVECISFPKKDLETSLPDRKNCSEIKQDRNTKDQCKTKQKNLLKTQEELPQFSSQCNEKLDSLSSHERKRKLVFHDVMFQPSGKLMKCEQDSQEKKDMAQNTCPLTPKPVIMANKSKIQSMSPEKRKLKAGGSKYKLLENRKSDLGKTFDMERKKKYDKHEQNKNAGNSLKLSNSLSKERTSVKEKTASVVEESTNLEINSHKSLVKSSSSHISKSSDLKDNSHKTSNKVLSSKDYLQNNKESICKASKKSSVIDKMKSIPCDSECARPVKHSMQVENCGKSKEKNSSIQTSKELLNTSTGRDKPLKIYHPENSKIHKSSKNVKGNGGGKPPDKMLMDKTKSDKHLTNLNNEGAVIQIDPQAEDQRKLYLNRVGFKCTEHESICLSKLNSSSRKSTNDTQKSQENKPKNSISLKDTTEKSLLKFKLCPDVLFDNPPSDQWKQKPIPKKEQAPIQVSGIKSTKEAWLKCVNTEKRMREASHQKIDNNILPKSKLPKRSLSAEGLETSQNPVKSSKTMFQTYKKIYMEKQKPYNMM